MTEKATPASDAKINADAVQPIAPQMNDVANLIRTRLTTDELAALLHVKPQTIRAGLCNAGHYAGLRPAIRLPSRRLLWDAEQVASILNGEASNRN